MFGAFAHGYRSNSNEVLQPKIFISPDSTPPRYLSYLPYFGALAFLISFSLSLAYRELGRSDEADLLSSESLRIAEKAKEELDRANESASDDAEDDSDEKEGSDTGRED